MFRHYASFRLLFVYPTKAGMKRSGMTEHSNPDQFVIRSNPFKQMFQNRQQNKKILITYITGGDPSIETTEELILAMVEAGVDLIEIGMPFSVPDADGPVIKAANRRAQANGATTGKIFEMIARVRPKVQIPLVLMTYLPPVFGYGKERFLAACSDSGINGLIVPDMPFEQTRELSKDCTKLGIEIISLVYPTTNERIAMIAKEAKGFLYCASSIGKTGMRSEINADIERVVAQAKKFTNIPCAIGFGISNPDQAREMAKIADGIIVGSAIVKIIEEHGNDCVEPVKIFVKALREAIEGV